ncbi:tripartite tricarboxylate transporter substrate binding protein [Caldalkalibacillus salinus]|uniref:tripartite tricarboxylate transporter substrate binding protein n=1 Tax=Caldalkalibacillus salinus TaxID=2803787 RepID=UPI001924E52E|nr:tripartite tricarboxylate transporter substrate binding protein [Caldalkalibacillus salinus]
MPFISCKRLYFLTMLLFLSLTLLLAACSTEDTQGQSAEQGAQEWEPDKPVEYIAPANPGGGWDTLARTTAQVLETTGLASQPLPVVNKPGGGGAVGWSYMAGFEGDPHKLFVTSPPIILVPLNGNSEYDHTDFTPIARLITDYMIVGVKEDSEYETFDDLLEALENNPQDVSIAGGSAPGSMDHIAIAGAVNAAGLPAKEINYVPFSGGGEAITSLLGGHVDVVITGVGESTQHIDAGEMRVLAVSAPERLPHLPDTPTISESGFDYTFDLWRGVMAPKDMPDEAVTYYENLFAEMQDTPEWEEARDQLGWTDAYLTSEEFEAFLDEQSALFEDILAEIGMTE